MRNNLFLKILALHFFAHGLASASTSSWAFQQIEAEKAQELVRGTSSTNTTSVTVAVVDTGIDAHHPALRSALWTNPGEIPMNGIDDDGNGFIDDVHGWNFVNDSNDLTDFQGHGTHISGLIAAQSPQFQGVAPNAKIMALKYYDPKLSSYQNLKNAIRAFKYAIQMKAQIINFSGGGPGSNLEEENILREAEKSKILVVAASGNDSVDTDRFPYFPAGYPLANIVSVTATDALKQLPRFANYGARSIQIAAPGENIRSTAIGGGYIELSGTSQSTAIVTGVAALLLSQSSLPLEDLISKLRAGSQFESSLIGKTSDAGILNAYQSTAMKSSHEPAIDLGVPTSTSDGTYLVSLHSLDAPKGISHGDRKERVSNVTP